MVGRANSLTLCYFFLLVNADKMNKKGIWTIVIIIIILLGLWWILAAADSNEEGVEETASVEVSEQNPGDTIVAERVFLEEGGYVVVRNEDGEIIGTSVFLEAGEHDSVEVVLNETAEAGEQFEVVLFVDSDGDEEFSQTSDREFIRPRGGSPSRSASGSVVSEILVIVAEDQGGSETEADESPATSSDSEVESEPESDSEMESSNESDSVTESEVENNDTATSSMDSE